MGQIHVDPLDIELLHRGPKTASWGKIHLHAGLSRIKGIARRAMVCLDKSGSAEAVCLEPSH